MTVPRCLAALTVALLLTAGLRADDKKSPLELTVAVGKATYPLDASGVSAADLKKELDAAEADAKAGKMRFKLPAAPEAMVKLTITNTSKEDVTIHVGGDDTLIGLTLKGPGARAIEYGVAMTEEFRISRAVVLGPGKTFVAEIPTLEHGPRGRGKRLYWTEPGEYTLSATWQLGGGEDGGKRGPKLTGGPAKFAVEKGK